MKGKAYETLLQNEVHIDSERQLLRERLDSFLVLQFLTGPMGQRSGFIGFSLRLIAWITLVAAPILILLEAHVTFLPYHRESVVWLQRAAVVIDLVIIWYFWDRVRSGDVLIVSRVSSKIWARVGAVASFSVFMFVIVIATYPGEWIDQAFPKVRFVPATWPPDWSSKRDWTSLHELLFAGEVDELSGRPRSLFSNRLVLTNQSFVDDQEVDKVEFTRSFRGRDLRQAVLNRVDLRKADFTGAMLNGASLDYAKLQEAKLGCGKPSIIYPTPKDCTWLQGASLIGTQMQGAELDGARLEAANLSSAKLQGAWLAHAQMQTATLQHTQLQGAVLANARLQAANLFGTQLQGAWLLDAQLQGASLYADFHGAALQNAYVWFVRSRPGLHLTDIIVNPDRKPWEPFGESPSTFSVWRDGILNELPAHLREEARTTLSYLDPDERPVDLLRPPSFWEDARSSEAKIQGRQQQLALFLADLACSRNSPPYIARSLIRSGRAYATEAHIIAFAGRLRKGNLVPAECPGVSGFTQDDWAQLDQLVTRVCQTGREQSPGYRC